jgi:hypothetical protein
MALDPETKPREFMTVIVAAGLLIFRSDIHGASDAFKVAEEFVAEAERRVGKLNP